MKKNLNNLTLFKSLITKLKRKMLDITGMITRNSSQSLVGVFNRILKPLIGTTKYNIKAYFRFCRFLHSLYKSGGVRYVSIYLKTSSVLLQQSVGGYKTPSQKLGAAVAVTNSGIPRVIPVEMRKRIRARDRKVIQTWLTIFNMYRVMEFPGKLKLSTITDAGPRLELSKVVEFRDKFFHYLLRTNKALSSLVLDLRNQESKPLEAKPFLIGKASPTSRYSVFAIWKDSLKLHEKNKLDGYVRFTYDASGKFLGGGFDSRSLTNTSFSSTSPLSVVRAALALKVDSVLYPVFRDWLRLTKNDKLQSFFDEITEGWDPKNARELNYDHSYPLGKLGFKQEPGKIRVFAMVECWTQWIMHPLHEALFSILRLIPQDGTFDQHRPVKLLLDNITSRNGWDLYSFDLTAATDRLPVSVQEMILEPILGKALARLWKALLTWRSYKAFSERLNVNQDVQYAVGQPMGALSSWAMLAMTHHFIVQWAAYNARGDSTLPFSWFNEYAVLGDDIVIGDSAVAREYVALMDWLGVGINLSKSLISKKRVCEFAKRYYIPEDASPLPFKEFLLIERNSSVCIEYAKTNHLSLPDIFHALGYGFKTKGSLYTKKLDKMGKRVRRLLVALTAPGAPFHRSLKEWLTMDSLVSSSNHTHWDRVAQHMVATELPILIQRVSALRVKLGVLFLEGGAYSSTSYFDSQFQFLDNSENQRSLSESWVDLFEAKEKARERLRVKVKGKWEYYETPVPGYQISQWDLDSYGFKGDKKKLHELLFANIYWRDAALHYHTMVFLKNELLMIQEKLKSDPSSWTSIKFQSGQFTDLFEFVEHLWNAIDALETMFADIPSSSVLQVGKVDYLDPSVAKAARWLRLRKKATGIKGESNLGSSTWKTLVDRLRSLLPKRRTKS